MGFLFAIANNRRVSQQKGQFLQIQEFDIRESGLMVYLQEFGWVKVFCQSFNNSIGYAGATPASLSFKNEVRYYIMYQPEEDELREINRQRFRTIHDTHWQIESFHRVIKQMCNVERFQVRTESGIRTHLFCALQAFSQLQTMQIEGLIDNLYQVSRQLFVPVIRQFITENLPQSFAR